MLAGSNNPLVINDKKLRIYIPTSWMLTELRMIESWGSYSYKLLLCQVIWIPEWKICYLIP